MPNIKQPLTQYWLFKAETLEAMYMLLPWLANSKLNKPSWLFKLNKLDVNVVLPNCHMRLL